MAKGTVNKVILIGRLGADPDVRYTPSGQAVATLSVATNEAWKDQDGNNQERTDWHRVVLWRRLAEVAGEYLKKGHRVYIEGQLRTRSWDDKDGAKHWITEVIGQNMQMLESRQGAGSAPPVEPPPMPEQDLPNNSGSENDLPF